VATSFVDRRADLAAVTQRLSQGRVVTLTGAPGVGKTRLAMQVARRVRRAFPDGVCVVELAAVQDPALVAYTIVSALEIHDVAGGDVPAVLANFLRDRRLLLVLDNCEQVVAACAELVQTLLTGAAGLRILATSREVLRVTGEHVQPVAPLPTMSAEVSEQYAEELFAQRAAVAAPGFTITAENRAHVAGVCHRLDGLPLAIELAAAQMRTRSVQQLATGLDDRFVTLAATGRGEWLPQHRTMHAAVDWSFELCEPAERTLWAQVTVFAGGFDLDAAEQVCAGHGDLIELLDALVGKSVLIPEQTARGRMRYRMLDTLRRYGQDKLRASGDEAELGRAHADHYLQQAELAQRDWFSPRQASWFGWLHDEHDNLRAALDFHLTAGDASSAQRMASALWFHWVFSGRVAEGRLWLERTLVADVGPDSTATRAAALWTCATLASQQGDLDTACVQAAEAREIGRRTGDALTVGRAVARLAVLATYRRDVPQGEALLAEALSRYEALGEPASAYAVMARLNLAALRLTLGDLDTAAELAGRCAVSCRSRGDQILLANSLTFQAHSAWLQGNHQEATTHVRDALRLRRGDTAALNLAQLIEMLAWITAGSGDPENAAELLGAADQVWRTYGLQNLLQAGFYRAPRQECEARVRNALGDAAFETAVRRRSAMTISEIVAHALGEEAPPAAKLTGTDHPLTPRERQIAGLIAKGMSGKAIAAELVIAPRTAESHTENILRKLGYTSRAQIAAWAASRSSTDTPSE
jgi:predicted ATPase/DNA-binding CsgD family transcriptional regulator